MSIRFLINRIVYTLLMFLIVITLNFCLFRLMPGDPLSMVSREIGNSPEARAALEKVYGLDKYVELRAIMEKFAGCEWELITGPAKQWLSGEYDEGELVAAISEADRQCGSCGCEFDPLYKRALELL